MIEDEDMDQTKEIATNQYESEIEAGDVETKEHETQTQRQGGTTQGKWLIPSR